MSWQDTDKHLKNGKINKVQYLSLKEQSLTRMNDDIMWIFLLLKWQVLFMSNPALITFKKWIEKELRLSIQKIQWIVVGTHYPLTIPFYTKV